MYKMDRRGGGSKNRFLGHAQYVCRNNSKQMFVNFGK